MFQCGSHLTDFGETLNLFNIRQMYWTLHIKTYISFIDASDKFYTKAFLCVNQCLNIFDSGVQISCTQHIFVFPLQQCIWKCATVLHTTCIACLFKLKMEMLMRHIWLWDRLQVKILTGDRCDITHTKLITLQVAHSPRVRSNYKYYLVHLVKGSLCQKLFRLKFVNRNPL
jgi:hypothetical protein